MVRNVCGRYKHLGREFGGRVRGVGAVLMVAGSTGGLIRPPETLLAAVLGALKLAEPADPRVVPVDMVLSIVFLPLEGRVMPELLIGALAAFDDLRVTASLPS